MRVAVDATCWQLPRGFGRHARSLLTALLDVDRESEYTFLTDSPEAVPQLPPRARPRLVATSSPTTVAASSRGRRAVGDVLRMSRALGDSVYDLLLFPTVYSYVPVISRAKKIVIVHDITGDLYPELALHNRRARWLWRLKGAAGRRQADALVTVSEYSRQGIIEHYGVPPDRVHVVGEAADPIFRVLEDPRATPALKALGLDGARRMVVYLGGFSPHKNIAALVTVFGKLAGQPAYSDVDLVLVGENQSDPFYSCIDQIRDLARRTAPGRIVFTGFLADPDVVALLNRATVLVLPSMTEGFGLPAIEAAACGCPVIATDKSPLPALLGDGGLFVDPDRPETIEQALVQVLESSHLRAHMRDAGLAAAGRLSWPQAAADLFGLMRRVMN